MQSKPFYLTQLRLAAWYTGVMSLILMLCGFAIYRLIAHTHWLYLTKEMRDLAHQIEDQIEPALQYPGQIEPEAVLRVPGLCLVDQDCAAQNAAGSAAAQPATREQYEFASRNYCVRFLNLAQQPIAALQFPQTNPICRDPNFWQQKQDGQGHFYHLESYPLHTQSQEDWGVIQIARSLDSLDIYLFQIELALVGVILAAIAMAGMSSWWLAGLAMRPIRQSYRQMEQFTADAAHELRTPLAALKAMVQTALRCKDLSSDDAKETLYLINRQSSRLARLVQDLLTLCQIEQAKPAQPSICCLNLLIQDLIDEFAAIALSSKVSLAAEIPEHTSIQVSGDAEQLYRAVANLLSNAIQYTPPGKTVTVILRQNATHALIQVQDTGVGIAPEEKAKIFDRFYRIDRERSRQRGGAGLGLAIVQAIVQMHQGTIQVQSELNQGSDFTIRLPLLHYLH